MLARPRLVGQKYFRGETGDRHTMLIRKTGYHRIIGAATAALLASVAPSYAADLGGDCCADLEERIAELEATTARKGNRKVSVQVSGQIHTGVLFYDDGDESGALVTDQDNTASRFRFIGSAKINPEWSAGFWLEVEVDVSASNLVTQFNDDVVGAGGALNLRQANWWIESKQLGRITVGQGSPANDDIILADAAGAGPAAFADQLIGNALFFRLGNGVLTDLSSNLVTGGSLDTARRNVVRYDSPIFQGAKFVASFGEDDFWDVAIWYANKLGDVKIVGGIGYAQDTDGFNTDLKIEEFKGSISVLHEPSGLFGSFAFVNRQPALNNVETLEYYYFNGGVVVPKLVPIGKTVFYGEYANGQGFGSSAATATDPAAIAGTFDVGNVLDAELSVYGFGVVQHIPAAEMEIYALYKNFELDARTAGGSLDLDDIDIVYTGARIRF